CSIIFGKNVTDAVPGSAQGLYLIVSDIEAARKELLRHGASVSEVFHGGNGVYSGSDEAYLFGSIRVSGPDPERRSYRSFASFKDPDGNGWLMQEITTRLPGRVAGNTTYSSASDLSKALQRAAKAHGEHEKRIGQADANWPDWYAEYLVREQSVGKSCRSETLRRHHHRDWPARSVPGGVLFGCGKDRRHHRTPQLWRCLRERWSVFIR